MLKASLPEVFILETVLMSIPISNTSVNPARSFGPAVYAGGEPLCPRFGCSLLLASWAASLEAYSGNGSSRTKPSVAIRGGLPISLAPIPPL